MASTIEDKDTVKSQNVEYWVGEGKKFYEDKKYEEAIKCYEKVTKLAPNNALAFYNWGYALSELAKINQSQDEDLFKNSFEKYNKATQLNPNYASAFYNWGYALSDLAEIKQNEDLFKSAFEKYEEAVRLYEINTDKASAFYMWGYAILNLAEINQDETLFKSAFEKYEEAARLYETDTDKASAFYIWGYAILSLAKIKQDETFQKNLETFEIASEDINDSDIFLIKGELYFVLGKAEKTMKYFEKSKKDILEILTFLDKDNGEKIIETNFLHPLLDLDNNDGRFFTETIGLKPEDQREKYKKVYIRSIFIISLLHVNNENEKLVAHYCEKDISQTLLFSSDNKINKFRLNAIDYSNDPDEGKTLLNFLYEEKRPSDEKLNNEDYEAFAGCFVLDYDNLNMFRLYGKDGHSREGNGLSIVFRDNFFSKEAKMAFEKPKADSRMEEDKSSLYRCIYIDPETQHIITIGQKEEYLFYREKIGDKFESYNKDMNKIIGLVRKEMDALKKQAEKLDPVIVAQLLLNLRYLVKHIAFKEEQECRIVKILHLQDEKININDYKQMYIEYPPKISLHVAKIYFGPKAEGFGLFQSILKNKGLKIECKKSENPLA